MNSNNRKIALVTGANGGLGRVISHELIKSGCKVILSCRPGSEGMKFCRSLVGEYGEETVSVLEMDLSSLDSVRQAALILKDREDHLDILINNAGMLGWKPEITSEGYEMHNMVNCLGPVTFTWLIKPLLGKGSRVINTVSVMLRKGRIPVYFPMPPEKFNRFERYACSKLAFTLCSVRMASLWKEEGISVNMVDPGIVNTPIIKMHKWIDPLTDVFFRPIIRQAPRGASTTVFLALDPSVEGISGKLFKDKKPVRLPSGLSAIQSLDSVWSFFITLNTYGNKQ
ncbi:MAG: SDR family NAD(P)-dependent oxidoreductase [Bacteroidales bacterium]|jgi:NAD(P)-dependent dehydrogenase (short-subunit alcohol dehydrogenase family)